MALDQGDVTLGQSPDKLVPFYIPVEREVNVLSVNIQGIFKSKKNEKIIICNE